MSLRRLAMLLFVCAIAVTAQRSYNAPAAGAALVVSGASAAGATELREPVVRARDRVGSAFGRFGARIAAPAVRSMSSYTRNLLVELEPAIRRAQGREAKQARALSNRILQADSSAVAMLDAGRPIEAIRYAMYAKGLIPSVRQTVAEETAFR